MKLTRNSLILLAIILLAIFLRLYAISDESYWYDEGLSINFAKLGVPQMIEKLSTIEIHPPFYYLALHYWMDLFGHSEFATRFLSAIFGILAVFMIYKLCLLIFDKETAIISSLLLAVSTFHVYYSQEVRMYSFMPLLALLSVYFFLKLLERKSLADSVGYVISTTLLIYTHYMGVFIIFTQNIYFITLLLLSKKDSRPNFLRWIGLQIMVVLLFTPWLGGFINQMSRTMNPPALDSMNTIPRLPPPKYSLLLIKRLFTQYSGTWLIARILLVLSAFSLVIIEKRRPFVKLFKSNKIYLLSIWLLSPLVLPLIAPKFTRILYFGQYLIANSVALYILAARGISNIRFRYVKFVAVGVILVLSLVNTNELYTKVNKEPWQRAAKYIDKNARPGDLVIFNPPYYLDNAFNLYSKRTDIVKIGFPSESAGTTYVVENNIEELDRFLVGHDRVWFVQAHIHDPKGLIGKTLLKSYETTYNKKYHMITFYRPPKVYIGIKVHLFEKK